MQLPLASLPRRQFLRGGRQLATPLAARLKEMIVRKKSLGGILLSGLSLLLPLACTAGGQAVASAVESNGYEATVLASPGQGFALRWPEALVLLDSRRLLWSERGDVFVLDHSRGWGATAGGKLETLADGTGMVAAAQGFDGTLAALNRSGRVAWQRAASNRASNFQVAAEIQSKAMAIAGDAVYLLLDGQPPGRGAVAAFSLSGKAVGDWGTTPTDAIVQASLRGGGIAACPGGAVFFSTINSSQIIEIDPSSGKLRKLGAVRPGFQTMPAAAIRRAAREAGNRRSVAPLVKLGLASSRVLALACSRQGVLIRQVSQPGAGGEVEFWSSVSGELLGTLAAETSVLLGERDRTLYFGKLDDHGNFVLERIGYAITAVSRG